jgi:hypothetical protein
VFPDVKLDLPDGGSCGALTSAWFNEKLVYVSSVSSVYLKLYYSFSVPTRHYTFTHNLTTRQQDATLACQDPFKLLKKLPWMTHWRCPGAESKATRDSSLGSR